MPIFIKLCITFMDINHETKKEFYLSVGFKIKRKLVLRDCFLLYRGNGFLFCIKVQSLKLNNCYYDFIIIFITQPHLNLLNEHYKSANTWFIRHSILLP